jgi:hypothetical protein
VSHFSAFLDTPRIDIYNDLDFPSRFPNNETTDTTPRAHGRATAPSLVLASPRAGTAAKEVAMDDVVNRLAKELADAIAAAVAEDQRVEACRERARAAGFDMKVSLEAVVGFVNRSPNGQANRQTGRAPHARRNLEMSANDRRFLRSLRIAADETAEEVE